MLVSNYISRLILSFLLIVELTPLCSFASSAHSINISSRKADSLSIPISFKNGLPIIKSKVGGWEYNFLLDLGGRITLHLDPKVLALHGRMTGRKKSSVNINNQLTTYHEFLLPEISIGEALFHDTLAYEFIPWSVNLQAETNHMTELGYQGVIGLEFFRGYNLLIDYPKNILHVLKPGKTLASYKVEQWHQASFELEEDGIVLKLNAYRKPLSAVLDTGANCSIIKKQYPLPSHALSECKDPSHPSTCALGVIPALKLKGHDIGPRIFYRAEFTQPSVDAILGTDFFQSFHLLINIEDKTLFFMRSEEPLLRQEKQQDFPK